MNTYSSRGFTFLEVLIVVAIVAIVASIAMPSYQRYVNNQKRIALQATLTQIAQKLENYKMSNGDYGATNSNSTYAANALLNPAIYGSAVYPPVGSTTQYNLIIRPSGGTGNGSSATSNSWEVIASPQGALAKDGTVKLNDQGWRCWNRTATTICTPSATSNWDAGTSS